MSIKVTNLVPHYNNEGLVITYFENLTQMQSVYEPTPQEAIGIIHYLSSLLMKNEEAKWKEYNDDVSENGMAYGDEVCAYCGGQLEVINQGYCTESCYRLDNEPETITCPTCKGDIDMSIGSCIPCHGEPTEYDTWDGDASDSD